MPIERLRSALTLRLAAWYFGVSAAGTILIVTLTYAMLASSLHERDHEDVRTLVERYARVYGQGGLRAVENTVAGDRQAGRYEPFFVRISRGSESALFVTLPAHWGPLDLSALDRSDFAAGGWAEMTLDGGETPLDVSGVRLIDGTTLLVGKSSRLRQDALARFRAGIVLILAAVFVASLSGGIVLTYAALAPLRAMTATIQRIVRTGKLDARVPARESSDPLAAAARLFNDLLERLDRLIIGMRQTLDNTAHDLRTPLTRARGRVEAALQRPGDAAAQTAALEDTLEEIDRIDHMLSTLMDISEAEAGTMRLSREPVPVAGLFEETIDLYADVADTRGVTLTGEAAEGLVVDGDRARLRQVLANLVDNAIKYTGAGGRVALRGVAAGDAIEMQVEDTGRGIPADELPRIWDRLFRGDASRAERGLGLGLSLVKAIVDAHGGEVRVTSAPGRGSVFTVRLPRFLSRM